MGQSKVKFKVRRPSFNQIVFFPNYIAESGLPSERLFLS